MRIWTTVIGQRLDGAENTRSMLLCAELLRRGHEVTMWTSAYDHIRKEWRREWRAQPNGYRRGDGLMIRFMKGCGYSRNISVRRFVDHYLAARDFARQAGTLPRPDAIVASLPDHVTAAAAVAFGKRSNVPTIVDVRDKWPDVFVDRFAASGLGGAANALLTFEHRRSRYALQTADALVAVMESLLVWGLAKGNRPRTARDSVFYLTTSPKNFDVPLPVPDASLATLLDDLRGRVIFAFVGTFNKTQHPSLLLDAVDLLAADGRLDANRFALVIAGDGIESDEVRRRAAARSNVHYIGWVNSEQMSQLLAGVDVGVLPMNFASEAFNNKAFAYLASGLPIINGAVGDLAELMASEHAGINVPAGDARALRDAMVTLVEDPALRAELRANIRRLFVKRFDREANYRDYVDHVERVAASREE